MVFILGLVVMLAIYKIDRQQSEICKWKGMFYELRQHQTPTKPKLKLVP